MVQQLYWPASPACKPLTKSCSNSFFGSFLLQVQNAHVWKRTWASMFEVCDSVCNTQCVSRTVTVCVLGSVIFAILHDGPNIYLAAPYLTSPHNDQCQYNCKAEKTWNIFHRTNNWKRAGSCLILKKWFMKWQSIAIFHTGNCLIWQFVTSIRRTKRLNILN